jgi:rhodanese-related sulfurtransferase
VDREPDGSAPHIQATDRLSPQTAAERMAQTNPPLVIDVRAPRERAEKTIGGTMHMPLNTLRSSMSDVPRDRPLVVFCAGGYRSSIAASVLQRDGFTNVSELAGGIAAWEAAGLPLSGSGHAT